MPQRFDLSAIDTVEIGRLMKLLAGTDIAECEIEQGQYSISIKRDPVASAPSGGSEVKIAQDGEQPDGEPLAVLSPAVGIFYRTERRLGPPDAEEGARVAVGDVLGCIEVMGVPHAVFSTLEGVVEGFLVDDGEAVEFGQPIVAIGD